MPVRRGTVLGTHVPVAESWWITEPSRGKAKERRILVMKLTCGEVRQRKGADMVPGVEPRYSYCRCPGK